MSDDWKPFKVFVPPPPLTKQELEPQFKQFEEWAGSIEEAPTKEQVEKLFIDGYQAGRERGFEEGYGKAGKETARHFTAARSRSYYREEEKNPDGSVTIHTTSIEASERTNSDLMANELNQIIDGYAVLPDKVKLDAIYDVLKNRFGVKIDRGGENR